MPVALKFCAGEFTWDRGVAGVRVPFLELVCIEEAKDDFDDYRPIQGRGWGSS
jgi:hypothetical protein